MLTLNSEKYFLSSENIFSHLKTFPLIHYPKIFSLLSDWKYPLPVSVHVVINQLPVLVIQFHVEGSS